GGGRDSERGAWCERRDSNPHGFPRQILSLVRLPIPPLSHVHNHLHAGAGVPYESSGRVAAGAIVPTMAAMARNRPQAAAMAHIGRRWPPGQGRPSGTAQIQRLASKLTDEIFAVP